MVGASGKGYTPSCMGFGPRGPGGCLLQGQRRLRFARQQTIKQDKNSCPCLPVVAFPQQGPADPGQTHLIPTVLPPQAEGQGKSRVQDTFSLCCSELGLPLACACSSSLIMIKPRPGASGEFLGTICFIMQSKLPTHWLHPYFS